MLRTFIQQFAARQYADLVATDCDSLTAVVRLVCSGSHVTLLPHFALKLELRAKQIVGIPIIDPTPSWRLAVVVSPRTLNQRGSAAVAQVLANLIAQMVREGNWRARLTAS